MIQILFVDDETRVLDALRRQLHAQRMVWRLRFATSARDGLVILERERIDVVVTDMRMPNMDGSTFLEHVRERFPDTIRIVLSGHADADAALRALSVAHQFLSKPCDAAVLLSVLERSLAMRAAVSNERVRALLHRVGSLPPQPDVYLQLTRRLSDPDCTIHQLESLVGRDEALAANVMHYANSAFFGRAGQLVSLGAAVSLLGTNGLRHVVLSAEIFKDFGPISGQARIDAETLRQEAVQVARIAAQLVGDPADRDEAFAAGLLRDVGRLVLASRLPEEFRLIELLHAGSGRPRAEIEREVLGLHHGEIAGHLFTLWGLPIAVIEAAVAHPDLSLDALQPLDIPQAVAVAEEFVEQSQPLEPGVPARVSRFGSDPRWSEWQARVAALDDAEAA